MHWVCLITGLLTLESLALSSASSTPSCRVKPKDTGQVRGNDDFNKITQELVDEMTAENIEKNLKYYLLIIMSTLFAIVVHQSTLSGLLLRYIFQDQMQLLYKRKQLVIDLDFDFGN